MLFRVWSPNESGQERRTAQDTDTMYILTEAHDNNGYCIVLYCIYLLFLCILDISFYFILQWDTRNGLIFPRVVTFPLMNIFEFSSYI